MTIEAIEGVLGLEVNASRKIELRESPQEIVAKIVIAAMESVKSGEIKGTGRETYRRSNQCLYRVRNDRVFIDPPDDDFSKGLFIAVINRDKNISIDQRLKCAYLPRDPNLVQLSHVEVLSQDFDLHELRSLAHTFTYGPFVTKGQYDKAFSDFQNDLIKANS